MNSCRCLILTLSLVAANSVLASPLPVHIFNAPSSLLFGQSVAMSGDYIAIGSPYGGSRGRGFGQVTLFDAVTGTLLRTFDSPEPTDDLFGASIAMDNGRLLVGAMFDDTLGFSSGRAFLFDVATGDLLHTFDNPYPTAYDDFGSAVAIETDTVVIGARTADLFSRRPGQAFVFDATDGLLLHVIDDPLGSLSGFFGASVAVAGQQVVVGGNPYPDVVLFDTNTGDLVRSYSSPSPTPPRVERFGSALAIGGGQLLVGASGNESTGQAFLIDVASGQLVHTFDDPNPTRSDSFGFSVAMDDTYVAIGAIGDDSQGTNVGQVHLFDRSTGSLLATYDDPTVTDSDHFGSAIAIGDGRLLVGAYGDDTHGRFSGQAYLFEVVVPEPNAVALIAFGTMAVILARDHRAPRSTVGYGRL